jgi:ABC-type transport system involved in multi-copper enzyme maturation permease subunit
MQDIVTVAQSTFGKLARLKSLYVILVICVLDVWAMSRYGVLSLGMEKALVMDAAMAMALIVALVTAMSVAFEIPRELRDKSATYILSKPGGRNSYVWGKFCGISMLVIFNVAIVTVGSLLVYNSTFGETPWGIAASGALVAVEGIALVGIGLFLSVVASDTASVIGMLALFVLGHSAEMLARAMPNGLTNILSYALPNFYNLDIKTAIGNGMDVSNTYIGYGAVYGLAYALVFAALANIIFSRKDLR